MSSRPNTGPSDNASVSNTAILPKSLPSCDTIRANDSSSSLVCCITSGARPAPPPIPPLISTGIVLPSGNGTTASVPCRVAGNPDLGPDTMPPLALLGNGRPPVPPILPRTPAAFSAPVARKSMARTVGVTPSCTKSSRLLRASIPAASMFDNARVAVSEPAACAFASWPAASIR